MAVSTPVLSVVVRLLALAFLLTLASCDDSGGNEALDAGSDAFDATTTLADANADPACESGATQPGPDGCGTCTCTDGEWVCLDGCTSLPAECPAPMATMGDDSCSGAVVFARDPVTSTCCRYDNACQAPEDWSQFFSQADCNSQCVDGATRTAEDGCNTCVCIDAEWSCTNNACADIDALTCESDADCFVTGCADEVCAAAEVATACSGAPGDACFTENSGCGCIEGMCAWAPSPELGACLENEVFCSPGEVRSAPDGCNQCWCTAAGTWTCGQKDCGFCPAADKNVQLCGGGPVWARDPITGVCCAYDDECSAPDDWPQFRSSAECAPTGCTPGDEQPAADGCGICTCNDDGEWSCTEETCDLVTCESDSDCIVTGCHGQICAGEERFTSCEWKQRYACYAEPFTSCTCNQGVCGWRQSDALEACAGSSN